MSASRELLHKLARLEQALRLESTPSMRGSFKLCDCGRQGRVGAKCGICLADDLKKLIGEQCRNLEAP